MSAAFSLSRPLPPSSRPGVNASAQSLPRLLLRSFAVDVLFALSILILPPLCQRSHPYLHTHPALLSIIPVPSSPLPLQKSCAHPVAFAPRRRPGSPAVDPASQVVWRSCCPRFADRVAESCGGQRPGFWQKMSVSSASPGAGQRQRSRSGEHLCRRLLRCQCCTHVFPCVFIRRR